MLLGKQSKKNKKYPGKEIWDFRRCKVESETTFKECYFKAPYIIDLEKIRELEKEKKKPLLTLDYCRASSAYKNLYFGNKKDDNGNVETERNGNKIIEVPDEAYYIIVDTDVEHGLTTINFYNADGDLIEQN